MRFTKVILRVLLALSSGALTALAFEPFDFMVVVLISLLPLLVILWRTGGKRPGWKGFGLGWLAGFTFFVINLKWLNTVTWEGALILPAYLALYWAFFGAFAATWGNPLRQVNEVTLKGAIYCSFSCATLWAGLEWLRRDSLR